MTNYWNTSGRIDDFEFVKVSNKDLDTELGKIQGVTGGTLSFSYDSSTKVSGNLTIVDAPSNMNEANYLIRIYFCPELNGSEKRIEIGTFYFTSNLHYENGVYHGDLQLKSTLCRFTEDELSQRWPFKQGKRVKELYKGVFKTLGGWPKIVGVKNNAVSKTSHIEPGESSMKVLQKIARLAKGEITVDTHGRTVLQPKVSPQNKAKSITNVIAANSASIVKPGYDVYNNWKESPNRVICIYQEQKKEKVEYTDKNGKKRTKTKTTPIQYVGKARLAKTDPRSFEKTGKWVTKHYDVDELKKPYKKNLDKLAAEHLKDFYKHTFYEFSCYYQPIKIGEVIRFKYDGLNVRGLVTNIDMDLAVGGSMSVKVRKV